ncbi:MAG: acetylxylan esterase [Bacteroidetes bacterium]|nr:acetylxylan esterase [Bacteroidota bacterium]
MRWLPFSITVFYFSNFFFSLDLLAQTDQIVLCQGNYFTEKEGAAFLNSIGPKSLIEWETRAKLLRSQIRRGMGLGQISSKPDLKPVIHSKKIMDGYTVENVFFESQPGHFVSGNLYRPLKKYASYAGILHPHGHFENGRFHEQTQIRSATLARMGAVVFAWDLIGYGDAKFMNHKDSLALKIQTINSTRCLDFLLSLENIDPNRIGISGESGGGTQSFILSALDDRIKVSVPAVMVSAHFFGGCVCESGLPIHFNEKNQTNNVEIAALMAPKPQLLISIGNDWTKNTPSVEFPFLKKIYGLYQKEDQVENVHLPTEIHNYGPNKRKALYEFMAKHLNLDYSAVLNMNGEINEEKSKVLSFKELSVYNENFPKPE